MIKSQFLRKSFVTLPLIIYLIINGLFVIKYGPFGLAGNTVLLGTYSVFFLLAFVFFNRIELRTVFFKSLCKIGISERGSAGCSGHGC